MNRPHVNAREFGQMERRILRVRLAQRGLTVTDLAGMIHYPPRQVMNVVAGCRPSWPICRAINRALSEAIFSRPQRTRKASKPTRKNL